MPDLAALSVEQFGIIGTALIALVTAAFTLRPTRTEKELGNLSTSIDIYRKRATDAEAEEGHVRADLESALDRIETLKAELVALERRAHTAREKADE